MFKRKCSVCGFIGIDSEFFNINKKICNSCINCKQSELVKSKMDSKIKKREYCKKWREDNKQHLKEYLLKWSMNNPDKVKEHRKNFYSKNRKSVNEYRKIYASKRRSEDPIFKLIGNLRNLIKNSLIKQGYSKNSHTFDIVGISYNEFYEYMESRFVDGMSWSNYGEWQIDHIVPISSAKTEKDALDLCNYKNLQPLWKIDNQVKSNRL